MKDIFGGFSLHGELGTLKQMYSQGDKTKFVKSVYLPEDTDLVRTNVPSDFFFFFPLTTTVLNLQPYQSKSKMYIADQNGLIKL